MAKVAASIDESAYADIAEPGLEFLGLVEARLAPAHALLDAPFGGRLIVDVTDARVEGPRLRASMVGTAAADWVTVSPDGRVGAQRHADVEKGVSNAKERWLRYRLYAVV